MTRLKQLAALTVLSGSLIAPAIALAEPTPPPGTTVNTIALTTVETNVTSSGAPVMNTMPASTMQPTDAVAPMADPAAAQDAAGDDEADMGQ